MVIPGCEISGRSGTEIHFSIFSEPFWDHSLVCRVVLVHAAGGGFWGCHARRVPLSFPQFAFSTDGVYCAHCFVQPVLELRVMATSKTTHRRLLFP